MSLKEELAQEMEDTRQNFHHLLDSLPETLYHHPSDNPAWAIGDVLYHITLGPPAIRFEIWMIRHARGLFQMAMNETISNVFNRVNALFAHQSKRITYQTLTKSYDKGHAGLISSLVRMKEDDFQKSVVYPEAFVVELAGEVTIERLFRYVKGHFDIHAEQILRALKESK